MIKFRTAFTTEVDDGAIALQEILDQLEPTTFLQNSAAIVTCHKEFLDTGVMQAVCSHLGIPNIGCNAMLSAVPGSPLSEYVLTVTVMTSDMVDFKTFNTVNYKDDMINSIYEMSDKITADGESPKAIFVLETMDVANGNDIVTNRLSKAIGDIPLFGTVGSHFDQILTNETYVFVNGVQEDEGIAIIAIYSDDEIKMRPGDGGLQDDRINILKDTFLNNDKDNDNDNQELNENADIKPSKSTKTTKTVKKSTKTKTKASEVATAKTVEKIEKLEKNRKSEKNDPKAEKTPPVRQIHPEFYYYPIQAHDTVKCDAIATETEGNMIKSINYVPTFDFFVNLGVINRENPELATLMPIMVDQRDGAENVARSIVAFQDGKAVCTAQIPVGAVLELGSVNKRHVVATAKKAVEQYVKSDAKLAIFVSCATRNLCLGLDMFAEINAIQEAMPPDKPFMFMYSGGEICPVNKKAEAGKLTRLHNNTLTMFLI
jgi:hypothetical protein